MWVVTVEDNRPGATENFSVWRTGYSRIEAARAAVQDAVEIEWSGLYGGVVYDNEEMDEGEPALVYELVWVEMKA